ncbi:MAG TPA: histidine phosphatase family protein [Spirochaetia bacterium]|nr:histidine phosphatase family protein [Spirochaetia bacterium]
MEKATRVLLVRHGETVWNAEGRLQGHLDSELTSRGVAQANSVAARLRDYRFDALYASDLGRAYKTAQKIAAATGCRIISEPRLRERNLGIFQGLTEGEIRVRYPEEWSRFRSMEPDYRVPDGESSRDRVVRSRSLLDEVAVRHRERTVLLVTHGGILDGIFRLVTGLPLELPRQFKIWNAGINIISRVSLGSEDAADTGPLHSGGPASAPADGWMIELWGDTGTLASGDALDDN